MKRNIAVAAMACLALTGALAGCGGTKSAASSATSAPAATSPTSGAPAAGGPLDDLTAQQISDRAVTAVKGLTSVHVAGQEMDGTKPMRMDVHVASDGPCLAMISNSGATVHVVGTRHTTYVKGDNAFWAQSGGSAAGAALHGRWLSTPGPASTDPQLKDFCSLSAFMASFTADDGGAKAKGQPTEIGGQRAIPITEKSKGDTTTVYVADSAQHPYVLKAVNSGSEGDGALVFDGFDQPVHAVPPPADQTVSRASLHL